MLASVALVLFAGCQNSRPRPLLVSQHNPLTAAAKQLATADPDLPAIRPVSFQQPDETDTSPVVPQQRLPANITNDLELEAAPNQAGLVQPSDAPGNSGPVVQAIQPATPTSAGVLSLNDILASVKDFYPEIEIAIGELQSGNGKILAAWGEFDQRLSAHSIAQPLGFYQTYRNGIGLSQPLYQGGEVYGTYRIGDGNFEPWYGDRETNEGGEIKAGFSIPLLKDRNIDQRRADLLATGLQLDQLQANVEARLLQFQRSATQSYWDWVANGRALLTYERLLKLASDRVSQIETRVQKGDLAPMAEIDNDRLIAKRKNTLIKARRSLEKAAIKLSLFWRDGQGTPIVVDPSRLPEQFPDATPISETQLQSDVQQALSVRNELVELRAQRRETCVDLEYARNLTMPKLDLKGFAGQDVGGAASSKGDKTPFELQVGVNAELPIQRREGLGKIQAATGKLTQIDAKLKFTTDKIRVEIQDAASAINAAYDQIRQSQENLELTRRSLELGRQLFDAGDIDLLLLNIYETSVADAELQLLDAKAKYFFYRAVYETAISGSAF